jgi:hypothetical protein
MNSDPHALSSGCRDSVVQVEPALHRAQVPASLAFCFCRKGSCDTVTAGPFNYHREKQMAYHLEGQLLEVCDCRVLCPCWIGEDPDNGTCDSVLAYHFEKGSIDGVDVAGRTIAMVSHIPGNVLQGNFRVALYVDDGASQSQQEAILNMYSGKLGGPIADFAKLIGEVVSVERAPITFDVHQGRGTLKIGEVSYAELEPYKGADGSTTTLSNTIFSTVPGAPVFVGKAATYRSKQPALGHDLNLTGHNALQSVFVFDG